MLGAGRSNVIERRGKTKLFSEFSDSREMFGYVYCAV